jgi:hypothetical protein
MRWSCLACFYRKAAKFDHLANATRISQQNPVDDAEILAPKLRTNPARFAAVADAAWDEKIFIGRRS